MGVLVRPEGFPSIHPLGCGGKNFHAPFVTRALSLVHPFTLNTSQAIFALAKVHFCNGL